MTAPLLVCGFLGAGKSAVLSRLGEAGIHATELDGLTAPSSGYAGQQAAVIAVMDCANFAWLIEDGLTGPLIRRQIEAAGLVVLSRADLADPEPVRNWLASEGATPVVEPSEVADAAAEMTTTVMGPSVQDDDLRASFERWSYHGPARLSFARAESLVEQRPKGVLRLAGCIRTDTAGMEVQITGRVRQTLKTTQPEGTELTAIWPKGSTRSSTLDNWFAEAVADSAHRMGMFGYR